MQKGHIRKETWKHNNRNTDLAQKIQIKHCSTSWDRKILNMRGRMKGEANYSECKSTKKQNYQLQIIRSMCQLFYRNLFLVFKPVTCRVKTFLTLFSICERSDHLTKNPKTTPEAEACKVLLLFPGQQQKILLAVIRAVSCSRCLFLSGCSFEMFTIKIRM